MRKTASSRKRFSVVAAIALAGGISAAALAQTSFSGFTPGNLIVSRTVYSGTSSTVTVGQALPPVCPATAACGTGKAASDGTYPGVWANNVVDGSFGITSPIFLDQITPTGTAVSTLAVPSNMVNTSFSSKSELALNVSGDGTAITFMAYVAPSNTVDVSNSNTPETYDPTNPAGGSYYRAVVQVGANGAIQVTPTNAYSGNNGRAAVLAGGQYYMVGNANNGGGTPENVIESTGVQMATPGQPAGTYPTAVGEFSITQLTDPTTGVPYPADKLGKDNNYRGLALFNNTLYVSKGSGGNGVNTVYQVGNTGSLPTLANAPSAPVKVLPGFTTTLAKNADATTIYPFGLFFANATTLYVADERDGVMADAATSKLAGLQKWSLVNGQWQMDYVLQNGLNLGQPYSVANYPASLNPATDGLRNITGRVNSDGKVTIWAVTSTVSANGDQGADPNKLVSITDTLASMTAASVANEQFTTIKSAAAGEVLRGVSFTPAAGSSAAVNSPLILSAASPSVVGIAQGSIATANGQNLSVGNPGAAPSPAPTTFGGVSVSIVDAGGRTTAAPLLFVSPNQINFDVPSTVATGIAQVMVTTGAGTQTAGNVEVATLAPGGVHVERDGAGGCECGSCLGQRDADRGTCVYDEWERDRGGADRHGCGDGSGLPDSLRHRIAGGRNEGRDGDHRGRERAGSVCGSAGEFRGIGPDECAGAGVARG
ncbi:MAG: hypothetical protein JWO80_1740 [Bryobacterales bacterium]|nr:hypothetical protein [Bryobacterales bacterium]